MREFVNNLKNLYEQNNYAECLQKINIMLTYLPLTQDIQEKRFECLIKTG